MVRDGIRRMAGWLRRAVTQPNEELNRWQRAARFAYDLGRYGARQLREDRAPQMAAALAFRTMFGLAPVFVVATILVKAIKGPDSIMRSFRELSVALGLDKIGIAGMDDPTLVPDVNAVNLSEWLQRLTEQLLQTNLSAIGWVGFAVILYAAIGLMVTIENSFNIIYRAPDGRPWMRRVPLYWFILTVGPVMFGVASYANDHFTGWIASVDTWQWVLVLVRSVWSFSLLWLFMVAVYSLLPNSSVTLRPAISGAFVAALLLVVGKHTLGAYLGNAFSANQLYGVLGLVPLFMLWVYLMWLAVLFGLQVSATLQVLRGRGLEEINPPAQRIGALDPVFVLTIMEVIADGFTRGKPMTAEQVAEALSLPTASVSRILERLVQDGWLHRLERPEGAVSLTQPPQQLQAADFIKIGYQLIDENRPCRESALGDRLRLAQQEVAQGITLASLVGQAPQPTSK